MTMMMTDPISILFTSDLHFGRPNMDQNEMADAFAKVVFPLLEKTDIFFINGDFFDQVVSFDGYGFDPICDTIFNLFSLCDDHKVILRVLQGTYEHDRTQCHRLVNFYKNGRYTFDFRYVGGIELEEIWCKNRDLRFFFVPDDLPFNASDDIVAVVQNKMVEMGWDHIDYGCMHGYFEFNYPKAAPRDKVKVFDGGQFPFVRKVIDVGHVHDHHIEPSPKGKTYPTVISNGSFDRLNFGEEGPKGLIQILDYPDHYKAHFVPNPHAAIWNTLDFGEGDSTETVSERISAHLAKLDTDRRISLRFRISSFELKDAIKSWMKDNHPKVSIKFKSADDVKKSLMIPSSELFISVEKREAPTPKTLSTHIRAHIPENYILSIEEIDARLAMPL